MKKSSLFLLMFLLVSLVVLISCGESVKEPASPARIFHLDIDSSPRGADVYWHVLSKTDEVSSTNRFHLGQTPIEGTQNLRIPNLTKKNAADVEIVIEIEKLDCKSCYTRTFYMNVLSILNSRGISKFANLKNSE